MQTSILPVWYTSLLCAPTDHWTNSVELEEYLDVANSITTALEGCFIAGTGAGGTWSFVTQDDISVGAFSHYQNGEPRRFFFSDDPAVGGSGSGPWSRGSRVADTDTAGLPAKSTAGGWGASNGPIRDNAYRYDSGGDATGHASGGARKGMWGMTSLPEGRTGDSNADTSGTGIASGGGRLLGRSTLNPDGGEYGYGAGESASGGVDDRGRTTFSRGGASAGAAITGSLGLDSEDGNSSRDEHGNFIHGKCDDGGYTGSVRDGSGEGAGRSRGSRRGLHYRILTSMEPDVGQLRSPATSHLRSGGFTGVTGTVGRSIHAGSASGDASDAPSASNGGVNRVTPSRGSRAGGIGLGPFGKRTRLTYGLY
jgi:hypothetical protein